MQKLLGNNCKLFIIDDLGPYYTLDSVAEIEIEDSDVSEQKVIETFIKNQSFVCEIENVAEFEDNIRKLLLPEPEKEICEIRNRDYKKPNPVYVPKHIARRRKW